MLIKLIILPVSEFLEFTDVKKTPHVCFQRRHWCISSNHWHLVQCWPLIKDMKQFEFWKSSCQYKKLRNSLYIIEEDSNRSFVFCKHFWWSEGNSLFYILYLTYLFAFLDFTKEAHRCRCLQEMFAENCKSKWRKIPCKFKQTCRGCVFQHMLGHTEVMNLLH